MQNQVIAEIEIEDQKIEYYSSVSIRQHFNAHHEFVIRIKYDVLEKVGSFSLSNAQKLIGKTAIIKLMQAGSLEVAYEFRGIVCEISMEQSDNFTSDLVLKGYSPTILIENGPHLHSFNNKGLKDIVKEITGPLSQHCNITVSPQHSSEFTYICQYRESGFHFINRLAAEYGEWMYYDGKEFFFGKRSSSPEVDVTYGQDVHNMQLTLRILPMNFSSYSYASKNDTVHTAKAPAGVSGLNEYASFALKESDKIFSEPVQFPLRQRVGDRGELEEMLKKQRAAIAADLEVLSGSSDNPSLCIGAIANVRFSKFENNAFSSEDYGKFMITKIEHHVSDNGKYHNSFEAVPSTIEVLPVKNVSLPVAEPQIATVTDNADPDNMGRVRVQMLWQKESGGMTDWLRVMTSDAGSSDEVSKNRGFMFVPEIDDQVLVAFRYNDADRPFVLGSLYHGKTGAGGGPDNNVKMLSTRSGHVIELNDESGAESITIKDKNDNTIIIDTAGSSILIKDTNGNNMTIDSSDNSIGIKALGTITLAAANINLAAASTVNIQATASFNLNTMNSLSNVSKTTLLRTKNLTNMVAEAFSSSATTINQTASKDINSKAKEKMVFSAKKKLEQRAGEMDVSTDKGKLRLSSKSNTEIKGQQVKTN